MSLLGSSIARFLDRRGWELRKRADVEDEDFDADFLELYADCEPFTMTSQARMYALYQAVRHVVETGVPGEIVECGVWRGGSSMLAASVLARLGDTERAIYLYDTFAGMPEPGERDVTTAGESALPTWRAGRRGDANEWCWSSLDEVKANMRRTGYPDERLRFVEGKVEDTIPEVVPDEIAVLRLDTDWYESTWHELVHLYPRLSAGGVLLIDDYGHWAGAREAVDRYFAEAGGRPLLSRIDYTGRVGVKAA